MSHAIHDFAAKLRQPSIAPTLDAYVNWRRRVREAEQSGDTLPPAPEIAPVSINLDLTTVCNYRCAHCIDWDILNTKDRIEEEELHSSIRLMAERGLRSIILIGGGEPTLYPGFVEFVRFAKQELCLQVAVVSNGSRGDRLLEIAPLLDSSDWIRLSLDAGSNELFTKMHLPMSTRVTLDEICSWIPRIRACNDQVRLGFSYIIVWRGASRGDEELLENIHEILPAAVRAKEHGFHYISFKPVLERQLEGAEVMDPSKTTESTLGVLRRIRDEIARAQEIADENFQVFESTNLQTLEQGTWEELTRQPHTCHMQALRQVLTPTGVFNCPAHRGVEKARVCGKDGYENPERAAQTGTDLGRILDAFDASVECREVTCLYNDVNWWIESMIEDPAFEQVARGEENADYFL